MDAEMINRMALEQLMHGNFVQAQNLFKTNKKPPNLGGFLAYIIYYFQPLHE